MLGPGWPGVTAATVSADAPSTDGHRHVESSGMRTIVETSSGRCRENARDIGGSWFVRSRRLHEHPSRSSKKSETDFRWWNVACWAPVRWRRPRLRVCSAESLWAYTSSTAPPQAAPTPRRDRSSLDSANEQVVTDAELIERISVAHCGRSQLCSRIGPGTTHRDGSECMSQMRARIVEQLLASPCPGGIAEAQVARCVTSLRTSPCNESAETYADRGQTIAEPCQPDRMCLQ